MKINFSLLYHEGLRKQKAGRRCDFMMPKRSLPEAQVADL